MEEQIFYICKFDDNLFIKLCEQITMNNAGPFAAFFKDLCYKDYKNIIFDFANMEYLDSTAIGILAKAAIAFFQCTKKKIVFINIRKKYFVDQSITGLRPFLDIKKNIKFSLDKSNFTAIPLNKHEINGRLILEAHKNLANLNKENKKKYSTLIKLLEESIKEK